MFEDKFKKFSENIHKIDNSFDGVFKTTDQALSILNDERYNLIFRYSSTFLLMWKMQELDETSFRKDLL